MTPATNDLTERFPRNPLLRPADLKPSRPDWQIECLLNPGVFYFDERTWLLVRVAERPKQRPGFISFPILSEDGEARILEFALDDPLLDVSDPRILRYHGVHYLTTLSHLRLMSSEDGISFSESKDNPLLHGLGPCETFGIEDCRVSRLNGAYYLTYTAVSPNGVAVGMRSTPDWKTFREHGLILPPHNKDCAVFEEKIGGRYFALHRPSSPEIGGNYIWLAQSPDLLHWGKHICVARTRPGMWDSARAGAGAAPIRTPAGNLPRRERAESLLSGCTLARSGRARESHCPLNGADHGTACRLRTNRFLRQCGVYKWTSGGWGYGDDLLWGLGQRHLRSEVFHSRNSFDPKAR